MRLILASTSPRRRKLLSEAGYSFTVIPPDLDESTLVVMPGGPRRHAEALALAKARTVARRFPDALVLGADTLVDADGEIIGKPADAEEAERITRRLFRKPHRVITGLALIRLRDRIEIVRSEVTTVYPRKLTERQIAEHVAGGSWRGKSGAYAIRETDDPFVDHVEGSLSNVMGLPLELLHRLLNELCQRR